MEILNTQTDNIPRNRVRSVRNKKKFEEVFNLEQVQHLTIRSRAVLILWVKRMAIFCRKVVKNYPGGLFCGAGLRLESGNARLGSKL